MTEGVALIACSWCHVRRRPDQLLLVTRRRTGERRYVCQVSVGRWCMHESVGPANVETIAAADPQAERAAFSRWPQAGPGRAWVPADQWPEARREYRAQQRDAQRERVE